MTRIETNLSEGSVVKNLVLFALPYLGSNIIQSLYNVADMLIVGNFSGTVAMSGVNIGGQISLILTNTAVGLCMGATVLIGQYIGAHKKNALKQVTATIITVLVIGGFAISVIMLVLKNPILRLIRTPQEAFTESSNYLVVTLIGTVFIFGYNALSAILRGMGNSKHPFYYVTIACITNIFLDLLFVAVFKMAALGAAIATVASQALSMFLCIRYMIKNNFQFDFKLSSFKIYPEQFKLILKIGFPTCVQNSITSISFLFITALVNIVGGVTASAAVGAVGKFNGFAFMPTMAMSASISVMAAQNIGAGKLPRAIKSLKIGLLFSVCIMYVFFLLVQLYPANILALFGKDPAMIQAGITYLRSFAFDFLVVPFIFCINGFLIGGGHTMFTLITGVFSSLILRIPVCYFFGVVLDRGLWGIGIGAPAASFGVLIIIVVYLISGKWKNNPLFEQTERNTKESPV
jgi:putative MATE family efflux protein